MSQLKTFEKANMLKQGDIIIKVIRTFNLTNIRYKSHYDVLGITPKATQNDIKSAYYKLSKVYHPDKSKDEESARKFRAITEAYEILGNIKLKKMYDKGLLVGQENTTRMEQAYSEPLDPTVKFYRSRQLRNVAHTIDGKTPIYDFDTWSKSHYGDLFNKSQYNKDLLRKRRAKQKDDEIYSGQERILYMMFAIGGIFAALIAFGKSDYDHDVTNKVVNTKENNGKASTS